MVGIGRMVGFLTAVFVAVVLVSLVVRAKDTEADAKIFKAAAAQSEQAKLDDLDPVKQYELWRIGDAGEKIRIYCDPRKPTRAFVVHLSHGYHANGSGIQVVDPMPEYCPPKAE